MCKIILKLSLRDLFDFLRGKISRHSNGFWAILILSKLSATNLIYKINKKMTKSFKITKLTNLHLFIKQKQLSPAFRWDPDNVENLMFPVLKKYFPKYIDKFVLTSKDHSVLLKVKRAKIIQDFEVKHEKYPSEKLRGYLRTKMKNVKVAVSNQQTPLQFLKKIRLFSNLSEIKMAQGGYFVLSKTQQNYCKRAWKMMTGLRKVKRLEITDFSNTSKNLLLKLNSAPKFLSSLKQLCISCSKEGGFGLSVLETMLNFKDFLRLLTHLNLPLIHQHFHYKSFQSLKNCCPNLLSLSFEFSCERNRVEINYLGAMRTFKNLKVLNIMVGDSFTLLRDFALPASIQELRMNFKECFSKSLMQQIEPRFNQIEENKLEIEKFFERNAILFMFYENFKSLKNLNTLELLFSSASDQKAYQYQSHFSNNILKKTSCLKNLTLLYPKSEKQTPNMFMFVFQDSYLSKFFESCESSRQTLESLEIGMNKIWYSKMELSKFENRFPKLSNITVTGNFDQDSVDWSVGGFLKQLIPLGGSIRMVKLETLIKRRIGSLVFLLVHLKQLEISSKAKIGLEIRFLDPKDLEDLEPSEDSFKDGIDRLKDISKVRGISVKVFMPTVHPRLNNFLEQCVKKLDDCELIQYNFRHRS